ncbi:hypothetical protein GP486_000271 [Trichoglossum hirsutum]|uniref:RRM domain-containing protein n=1 Tax=Trichoglossum hirsutum TaxID=265104 RepID=A0A9P8LI43_9PEZI|nr:hypothetical protein GP486_000271 [Trichoglossum hirsutum]
MPVTPPNSVGSLSSNASDQSPQTPYHGVSTYSTQNSSIEHSPLNGYSYSNNPASYMAFSSPGPVPLQTNHDYPRLGSYMHDALERQRFAYLLSQYPTIPWAIPAVYTAKTSLKTLEESLQNPLRIKNVYIRGLAPNTTDDLLLAYACRFGKVINHKAMIDPQNGTCKGFGFAKFSTFLEAELCIRGFYLRNYEELNSIFFGYEVESSRILRDSHGNSRGVGFARFTSRAASDEVIKLFHGQPVGREGLLLQVRYADTEEQKKLKDETTRRRQFRATEYTASARSVGHAPEYAAMARSAGHSPEPLPGLGTWRNVAPSGRAQSSFLSRNIQPNFCAAT